MKTMLKQHDQSSVSDLRKYKEKNKENSIN